MRRRAIAVLRVVPRVALRVVARVALRVVGAAGGPGAIPLPTCSWAEPKNPATNPASGSILK